MKNIIENIVAHTLENIQFKTSVKPYTISLNLLQNNDLRIYVHKFGSCPCKYNKLKSQIRFTCFNADDLKSETYPFSNIWSVEDNVCIGVRKMNLEMIPDDWKERSTISIAPGMMFQPV